MDLVEKEKKESVCVFSSLSSFCRRRRRQRRRAHLKTTNNTTNPPNPNQIPTQKTKQVLTPADEIHHINKHNFVTPFVCGCRDLGEALRRIAEGAAFIRTKGEAGTGNVVEAVRHARAVQGAIRQLQTMDDDELYVYAKEIRAPVEVVRQTKTLGRLPVMNFAAGGVSTPADAALMMQLGMDGVFVGSGIFKSGDPAARARAIVHAVAHYNDPKAVAEASTGLGTAIVGLDCRAKDFVSYANRDAD
jgi:pyridoxal 5'-phosphate synthase pdxS subunit